MASSDSRRGGVGGYIRGFLFGIVLVVLVLAGLSVVAPVERELPGGDDLTAVEDAEPEVAALEPAAEAVEVEGAVDIEGVAEEDLPVEDALDDVDPSLDEGAGDAIRPVELAELPDELPADAEAEAPGPGGTDSIPDKLEEILEGQAEAADEPAAETELGAVIEANEGAGEEVASAMPPPLEETRPIALEGPALQVNAASHPVPDDEPVVGVIMDGVAGSELSPDVLFALPVPVTLGIVPGREGDEALADAARARNWEVLAQLPVAGDDGEAVPGALSGRMPPEEVAERTEALMGRLRQAVAATSASEIEDPEAVQAMLRTLEAHGFGYVGAGAATGEGPPNAQPTTTVPRDATTEEVLAVLQEAVEGAGPGGASLVVLPPTRAAAEALARWNAEGGAGRVAPLSAVIARQAGG